MSADQIGKSVIDTAWETYVNDVVEAIESGLLDDSIQRIAKACFARRDEKKAAGLPVELHMQRDVLPKNPVQQEATLPAPAAPAPAKRPLKGRRRNSDPTFRFTDGRLYNRQDVVGRTLPYPNNPVFTIRIQGVGPKAAKVVFVDGAGVPITDPSSVPFKYRVASAKSGGYEVKDPIFMGLAAIAPIIRNCHPVDEN